MKNTQVTAKHKYIEQSTPNREEYLNELAFLGIAIGKSIPKENTAPQKVVPVLLIDIQLGIVSQSSPMATSGHL